MIAALLRFRHTIVVVMLAVTAVYGAVDLLVSSRAARTAGIGYLCVMVTIGVLMVACDASERRNGRDR